MAYYSEIIDGPETFLGVPVVKTSLSMQKVLEFDPVVGKLRFHASPPNGSKT